MPQDVADAGIVVHRLTSRFGFLSPLVTQQTGHPGLKARAERAVFARSFDVVHFHNISLVGGPAIIPWSRAPVSCHRDTGFFVPRPSSGSAGLAPEYQTCFTCSLMSGIPPQLWRYTSLVKRSVAHADALLAPSEYTARRHRDAGLKPPIHVLPLFSAIESRSVGSPPQRPRPQFLYVGRLIAPKGIGPCWRSSRGCRYLHVIDKRPPQRLNVVL
jgi:glycosyltransferase involved in cell wall biosynthesis